MDRFTRSLLIVAGIYLVTLLVLVSLSHIGSIAVTLDGEIRNGRGIVAFDSVGVLAAFMLVAVTGLGAVYILSRIRR